MESKDPLRDPQESTILKGKELNLRMNLPWVLFGTLNDGFHMDEGKRMAFQGWDDPKEVRQKRINSFLLLKKFRGYK